MVATAVVVIVLLMSSMVLPALGKGAAERVVGKLRLSCLFKRYVKIKASQLRIWINFPQETTDRPATHYDRSPCSQTRSGRTHDARKPSSAVTNALPYP